MSHWGVFVKGLDIFYSYLSRLLEFKVTGTRAIMNAQVQEKQPWGIRINAQEANISSGNDLSPVWYQAITWTNAGLLSIGDLHTNSNETGIKTQFFFHENAIKNICKMTNILFHPLVPVPHNPLSSANIHRITIVSYPCPRIKAIYHSKRSINSLVFMNQVPTYLSRVPDQLWLWYNLLVNKSKFRHITIKMTYRWFNAKET